MFLDNKIKILLNRAKMSLLIQKIQDSLLQDFAKIIENSKKKLGHKWHRSANSKRILDYGTKVKYIL